MWGELLAECPRVQVAAGDAFEAPPGTKLLILESGLVVSTCMPRRRRFIASIAGEGDVLPPPSHGIVLEALRPSVVRFVDAEMCATLLCDPAAGDEIVDGLLAAVLEREESLSHFGETVHRDRVLSKLLQLARKFGRVTPDGVRLDLPLTHQLLADSVAAARETVSIALGELQRVGAVQRIGRVYVLKRPPREID
jgi:CRP/FNR family transcriptional regulator, cyclic AMP receptor protein